MVVDTLINVFIDENEQAAAAQAARSEGVQLTGLRVLLVEDNEINQQIAVELLEGVGATVTITNHGREAVDRLTRGPLPPPFDVVLMDLQMPEMDGHQATAYLRKDPRFDALPIIAMTAHATTEERDRCLANGMNGHLSKPIEPAVLFATLGRLHKSAQPPAPSRAPGVAAAIPAIAGLDAVAGLARVAGNEKLYRKLLRQFAEQHSAAAAEISTAVAQGKVADAERLAHTVRGVAGNLGASAVQAAAGEVEKLIREKPLSERLAPALARLAGELEPLLAQLRIQLPADPPAAPSASAAADPAATHAAVQQLSALLDGFDAGAAEFAENSAGALRPVFGSDADWAKFMEQIRNFAFAEALAALKAAPGIMP
jgi:CheY-like chemotaxis protein